MQLENSLFLRISTMSLLLLILLSLFFIFVVYNLLQKPKYKLPPGPRPWPIIGNLGNVTFPTFRCFSNWSRDYGPIISVWRGPSLDILVSSAELAEQVLKENDHQLANRHRNAIVSMFTKDGLDLTWADYGPQYVKVRKVCTLELFSSKSLEALKPIREDEVTAMVESIFYDSTSPNNFGKGLLVRGYLREVTINSITRMVLGKRFGSVKKEIDEQAMEFKGIVDDMNKQSASLGLVQFIPWLKWIIWMKRKELGKHEARRDRFTRAIMAEHALSGESKTTTKPCFVEALMTQSEKYDLSDDTIIGLIWDMIIAGIDTSAILVEWAIAEVSRHPDVQLKAHQEFDMIIGSGRAMIESDLVNLPYLQCIVKETLRLHPPTPLMLPHKANADVKIGEYDIPRGSNVYVNVWAIGRDPAQWHDPLEFRPERFVVEDVDIKGHDFRLLPFGAGRRMCPGAQLGINLVSLMLGKLLHYFNWSLPEGIKPETIDMMEKPGLVAYMRTPLQAMVTPRLPKNLYKRLSMDV